MLVLHDGVEGGRGTQVPTAFLSETVKAAVINQTWYTTYIRPKRVN